MARREARLGSCSTRFSLLNMHRVARLDRIRGPARQDRHIRIARAGEADPGRGDLFGKREGLGHLRNEFARDFDVFETNGTSTACGERMWPPPSGVSKSKR